MYPHEEKMYGCKYKPYLKQFKHLKLSIDSYLIEINHWKLLFKSKIHSGISLICKFIYRHDNGYYQKNYSC